jgi:hypothetical protein
MARAPTCDCGECAKCRKRAYMREWYQRLTIEERRALVARRDKARIRERERRRPRDRRKVRARMAVANAIRRGKLERGACEVCGAPDAHAHHEDYDRPLDVRWLCPRHHASEHSANI